MAATAADRLSRAKSVSKKKATTRKKRELRKVAVSEETAVLTRKVCELGFLLKELGSPQDQHLKILKKEFFELWTEEMWEGKKKPDNFCVELPKMDEDGNPILDTVDTRCVFQLKFNVNGLKSKVPLDPEEYPEGCETTEESLQFLISEITGLSSENAQNFIEEEVTITDHITLAEPLDKMLGEDSESLMYKMGDKLLRYIQTRTASKSKKVSVPEFTEEEEKALLVTIPVIAIKDGMLDRVFTYCENLEQLRKLLTYCSVTLQIADFDFGMSDEPAVKSARLQKVVEKCMTIEESE